MADDLITIPPLTTEEFGMLGEAIGIMTKALAKPEVVIEELQFVPSIVMRTRKRHATIWRQNTKLLALN